jgi:hypothetical protein
MSNEHDNHVASAMPSPPKGQKSSTWLDAFLYSVSTLLPKPVAGATPANKSDQIVAAELPRRTAIGNSGHNVQQDVHADIRSAGQEIFERLVTGTLNDSSISAPLTPSPTKQQQLSPATKNAR